MIRESKRENVRERLAASALQGLLAWEGVGIDPIAAARLAVAYADALYVALEEAEGKAMFWDDERKEHSCVRSG